MPQSGNTITSESISATQLALKAVITSRIDDLAVTTAKINTEAVTQAKITANSIDGTIAANVAEVNVIGGIPVVHRVLASAWALNTAASRCSSRMSRTKHRPSPSNSSKPQPRWWTRCAAKPPRIPRTDPVRLSRR